MTVLAAVAAGPEVALLAGTLFGAARAFTLLLAVAARDRNTVERRFHWLLRHPQLARRGTAAGGALLSTALFVTI